MTESTETLIGTYDADAEMTTSIVAAYVGRNDVPLEKLTEVINTVHSAIVGLGKSAANAVKLVPAVAIEKSIFPDYIICLEDGKKLKMLKRHLQTAYKMTPEQYRAKWNLDANYPMTAPDYAKVRSTLAKQIGLGTNGGGRPAKVAKAKTAAKTKAPAKKKTAEKRKIAAAA